MAHFGFDIVWELIDGAVGLHRTSTTIPPSDTATRRGQLIGTWWSGMGSRHPEAERASVFTSEAVRQAALGTYASGSCDEDFHGALIRLR